MRAISHSSSSVSGVVGDQVDRVELRGERFHRLGEHLRLAGGPAAGGLDLVPGPVGVQGDGEVLLMPAGGRGGGGDECLVGQPGAGVVAAAVLLVVVGERRRPLPARCCRTARRGRSATRRRRGWRRTPPRRRGTARWLSESRSGNAPREWTGSTPTGRPLSRNTPTCAVVPDDGGHRHRTQLRGEERQPAHRTRIHRRPAAAPNTAGPAAHPRRRRRSRRRRGRGPRRRR